MHKVGFWVNNSSKILHEKAGERICSAYSATDDEIGGDVGTLELRICLLIHRQSLIVHVRLSVVAQEERANHRRSSEFLRLQRQVDIHRSNKPNQQSITVYITHAAFRDKPACYTASG